MNRRHFFGVLASVIAALGFTPRKAEHLEYPAQWLDWYHRDGKLFPVDHSFGAEYEGGELVWMQELAGEEPVLYRVPERPELGTRVTHIVPVSEFQSRRYTSRYMGVLRG